MGYKLIGKNKLIPRQDKIARRRVYQKAANSSPYDNVDLQVSIEEFIVPECSVQPVSGRSARDYNLKINMEGYRDHDSYLVFSSVMLQDSKEGTGLLPDQIFLEDVNGVERWFTVIKTDRFVTSGVARFQSFVVARPEG